MAEYVTQLGVGGIIAYLVVREVLTFLKNKDCNEKNCPDSSDGKLERYKEALVYRDNTCKATHEFVNIRLEKIDKALDEIKQDIKTILRKRDE